MMGVKKTRLVWMERSEQEGCDGGKGSQDRMRQGFEAAVRIWACTLRRGEAGGGFESEHCHDRLTF